MNFQRTIQPISIEFSVLAGAAVGTASLLLMLTVVLFTGAETLPQTRQGWWMFLFFFVAGNLVTVGVPVALYLRFGFIAPFFVLTAEFVFWLFLADGGDAPGYFFAIALWPVYLIAYFISASLEYVLRVHGVL